MACLTLLPHGDGLETKRRGDGICEWEIRAALSAKRETTVVVGIGRLQLEFGDLCGFFGGLGFIEFQNAGMLGEKAEPEQLGIHVRALKHGGDLTKIQAHAFDTGCQDIAAISAAGKGQKRFQEVSISVKAIHHSFGIIAAGKKVGMRADPKSEHGFIQLSEFHIPNGNAQIIPTHGRLRLIATGLARPARLIIERLFVGQGKNGMKDAIGDKIERHGEPDFTGTFQKRGLLGDAPDGEQSADDNAAIEEVDVGLIAIGDGLKGNGGGRGAPGIVDEKIGGAHCGLEIARVARDVVKIDQRASGVACDLGGNAGIAALIG